MTLQSPSDADYDLAVYWSACGGSPSAWSQNGMGQLDSIRVSNTDHSGVDDSFSVVIEVKFYATATTMACGNWTLTVTGGVP